MRKALLSFVACVLVVSGCSKSETPEPAQSTSVEAAIDACTLLSSAEIEAVQGEPVQESKSTGPADQSLAVSQCFFQLPTFTKSISLQVVRPGTAPRARSPKELWSDMFGPTKLEQFEKESGAKTSPARKIPDVGEQAFWTGGPAGGLFVLKGNSYIRISIGGTDDEETRIKKSTALARLILSRL